MSSRRGHFKDRILEGVAKAIKEVHGFSCGDDGDTQTITNDDRPLQKLVERLDHAFLHGLKNVTRGYWGVAKLFAHRGIIDEITKLDRLTTDLGRSRAWLYKCLNDTSLESYLRCFQENPNTMRKYYVETGILRDKQRIMLLQTLVSGLDFVTFDLEINIAYFDLVSYIPRSASISEPDEDVATPSNDSGATTPGTPATLPDTDGNSSIASSDAFSPMDDSPQTAVKILDVKSKPFKLEKQHSLPQHYSEIDKSNLDSTTETKSQGDGDELAGVQKPRSFSSGRILDAKPARPASLGVPSRNENILDASQKSVEDSINDGSLEVIRVRTRKAKKGHKKKKKGERSSINGDKMTRTGSSGTLSSLCDDVESSSPRLEAPAADTISKSSSHSSLHSFSDRGSLNEAPSLGKSDADSLNCMDMMNDKSLEKVKVDETDAAPAMPELIQNIDEETAASLDVTETGDMNQSKEPSLISNDLHLESESCNKDHNLSISENLAEHQPEIVCTDVKPSRGSASRSSLNFEETETMTLITPRPKDPALDDAQLTVAQPNQSSSESFLNQSLSDDHNNSLSSYPSETVPSFADLFTGTMPQISDEHPLPSPSSSSYSTSDISANPSEEGLTKSNGRNSRSIRTSSDASSSFKESTEGDDSISDVAKETVARDSLNAGEETHDAEIKVDNNLKLYLMLEIFSSEEEQFKKLIRMSTGHMEGDLQPVFILLTDRTLYILRRGDKRGHFSTQQKLPYNSLDYISVGLNYQTIQIVCTNRRKQFWLTTGDETQTRFFLCSLRRIMNECQQINEPVSILTDATAQVITLRKWAAQESKMETHDVKLQLYSLVHWEDLTDLTMTPDLQLYEPQVIRKGHLYYKVAGSFLLGSSWKKAWFVLRNEMFCRFIQRSDQQPDLSVQLRMPYFGGCRRVRNGERPHSFELILSDGASLELSCDTEEKVSDWLQAICQVVAQAQVAATSPTHAPPPCQPCCAVTTSRKLLLCHEDCQTNFYRLLAGVDITDITGLTSDPEDGTYVIVAIEMGKAQKPWVFYFNSAQEKTKFESTLCDVWKEQLQVPLPITPISDDRVQKRCRECSTLIQSSWQRSDSLMRGRIGGSIW